MNDQDAQRSPARRFFVLIGPSTVVGEGLAVEEVIVIRWRLIDDDEQDLALDVYARVIVPVILRRINP